MAAVGATRYSSKRKAHFLEQNKTEHLWTTANQAQGGQGPPHTKWGREGMSPNILPYCASTALANRFHPPDRRLTDPFLETDKD